MREQYQWFCAQVEWNKTALYRLARSILRSDEDAKNMVAKAVCKAFADLSALREPDRFLSWLMRITANEAYDILARRRRTAALAQSKQSYRSRMPKVMVSPWPFPCPRWSTISTEKPRRRHIWKPPLPSRAEVER